MPQIQHAGSATDAETIRPEPGLIKVGTKNMRKSTLAKQSILSAITRGNYAIKYEHECGCSMDWQIDADGRLVNDCGSEPAGRAMCCMSMVRR